jgi:hypothetical protein
VQRKNECRTSFCMLVLVKLSTKRSLSAQSFGRNWRPEN